MKRMFIAANWKSNITKNEAGIWLEAYSKNSVNTSSELVIFPPFTLLDFVSTFIKEKELNLKVGAQDISPFEKGSYTGEVSGELIKEFAEYVIIGHLERRRLLNEDKDLIFQKIDRALKNNLKILLCASNLEELAGIEDYEDMIIAFEPISAVGTKNPADLEIVRHFVNEIENRKSKIIYGGSINEENVKIYTDLENIHGVLVGSESLNVTSFINIISNVG